MRSQHGGPGDQSEASAWSHQRPWPGQAPGSGAGREERIGGPESQYIGGCWNIREGSLRNWTFLLTQSKRTIGNRIYFYFCKVSWLLFFFACNSREYKELSGIIKLVWELWDSIIYRSMKTWWSEPGLWALDWIFWTVDIWQIWMYSIYWRAESTSETNSKQEPGDNTRTCRDKSAGYNPAELHKYRTSIRVLSYSGDSVSKKKIFHIVLVHRCCSCSFLSRLTRWTRIEFRWGLQLQFFRKGLKLIEPGYEGQASPRA